MRGALCDIPVLCLPLNPADNRSPGGVRPSHSDRLLLQGRCGSALARLRLRLMFSGISIKATAPQFSFGESLIYRQLTYSILAKVDSLFSPSYTKTFASLLFIIQPHLWTSFIASAIHPLLSRTPANRRRAKIIGVTWLEGWPGLRLPFSITTAQE